MMKKLALAMLFVVPAVASYPCAFKSKKQFCRNPR